MNKYVAAGYEQVSRKFRRIARLPPGETGRQALERVDSQYVRDVEAQIERTCAEMYRRVYAEREGNMVELTVEEFAEFLYATGRSNGWKPKGPACEHCKSYGHQHTPECPNRTRR